MRKRGFAPRWVAAVAAATAAAVTAMEAAPASMPASSPASMPAPASMPLPASAPAPASMPARASSPEAPDAGVQALLAPWRGPHGGVPPLDRVRVADFPAALRAAMAAQREEWLAMAAQPEPATFDNTVAALERSGAALSRVLVLWQIWAASLATPEVQAAERALEPLLAAQRDALYQNAALFARIEAVRQGPQWARLTGEQQRLVWAKETEFVKHGARLDAPAKARVAAINQELAALQTRFAQHLLADEERAAAVVARAADLAGLPEADVRAAADAAARLGLPGQWAVANTRSVVEPLLALSPQRALRERVWRAFTARGEPANLPLIARILRLRGERAALMGFDSFAHWQLSDSMAREPAAAQALIRRVWRPALARLDGQLAAMARLARADGIARLEPWDVRYYAERLRRARYRFDAAELTPYLRLGPLREAMFATAKALYGLDFAPAPELPVFHADVTAWQVTRGGAHVGYWYFDPYAREGKRSGAWMDSWRAQQRMDGREVAPIVSNNANFKRGAPGADVTVTWDDAVTLFHEFGHALHGLVSNVTYPSLAGPAVLADFGEFPSQVMEYWLTTPRVLGQLTNARGQPLPARLLRQLAAQRRFDAPFAQAEYLASAYLDMALHLAAARGETALDVAAFEHATLAGLGMPAQMVARHRPAQFAHAFASEDYAAGYYNYLWAQVIAQDAYAAFTESGDAFNPVLARRYLETVLSVGNTVDPGAAYRAFRGRDATVDALLRAEGFTGATR